MLSCNDFELQERTATVAYLPSGHFYAAHLKGLFHIGTFLL